MNKKKPSEVGVVGLDTGKKNLELLEKVEWEIPIGRLEDLSLKSKDY